LWPCGTPPTCDKAQGGGDEAQGCTRQADATRDGEQDGGLRGGREGGRGAAVIHAPARARGMASYMPQPEV
jgi:hypothetical protein